MQLWRVVKRTILGLNFKPLSVVYSKKSPRQYKYMNNRLLEIDKVIKDLANYRFNAQEEEIFAIEENIIFFQKIRSRFGFMNWLLSSVPKLRNRARELFEINDFPIEGYDQLMHKRLIEVESRRFPGLIKPLVETLIKNIEKNKKDNIILASHGAGGMEVERQVLSNLIKKGNRKKITIVALDRSDIAHNIAEHNLKKDLGNKIKIIREKELYLSRVFGISAESSELYTVIVLRKDIFSIINEAIDDKFDISYHSLFRHHVSEKNRNLHDSILQRTSKLIIEYDGLYSRFFMLPVAVTEWHYPVFMEAAIFSNIRYTNKKEIKKRAHNLSAHLEFHLNNYLLQYD